MKVFGISMTDMHEVYDLGRSPLFRETRGDNERFPALSTGNNTRRKLHRHNTFTTRANYVVPEPGNEYDFRRSPESRYRRHMLAGNGPLRPHVPQDTHSRYAIFNNVDYCRGNHHGRESIDDSRCPTPMPKANHNQTAWNETSSKESHTF